MRYLESIKSTSRISRYNYNFYMIYRYDGTYEGLLTTLFITYKEDEDFVTIIKDEHFQTPIFDADVMVRTDIEKASRVRNGIIHRSSLKAERMLFQCLHSEAKNIENTIYKYFKKLMTSIHKYHKDFTCEHVLRLHQVQKMVLRESLRVKAFATFTEIDDMAYGIVNPEFDVLPLISQDVAEKKPEIGWVLYDLQRQYGAVYDMIDIRYLSATEMEHDMVQVDINLGKNMLDKNKLWSTLMQASHLSPKNNSRLYFKHIPHRYRMEVDHR